MGPALHDGGAWHSRDAVRRLVSELLAEEIFTLTRRKRPEAEVLGWPLSLTVDEDGLGLDSLARLEAATHVTQFFHLQEVGLEDRLLMDRTLGKWIEIVEISLGVKSERLTFRTSGSTGAPKPCTHEIADLLGEARAFRDILSPSHRVVSLVPPHHLFGFIFTVLLPAAAGVPVLDLRPVITGLSRHLEPDDVVVATPFHWSLVERTMTAFPGGVTAVSSTAPMPPELRARLAAKGLSRIVEVYGSSETAGIGWRESADAPYRLLPFWTRDGDGLERCGADGKPRARHAVPDRVRWHGDRHLEPQGRKDGAVKIGGINVFPHEIASRLAAHPGVADCMVSAKSLPEGTARLEAVIVAASAHSSGDDLIASLEAFCRHEFKPVERPASFRLVSTLSRTSMGKLVPA